MNTSIRLRVDVAYGYGKLPGFLRADLREGADVPFRPGDEFPFEDRAVEVLVVGNFVWTLARPAAARLLLECRRVLMPGGRMLVVAQPADSSLPAGSAAGRRDGARARDALVELAALVGLARKSPATPTQDFGVALVALDEGVGADAALAFTKPDRLVRGDPLVSILIPAYNPGFFAASLDSAVAQTYGNVEIVICDDSAGGEIEEMVRQRAGRREIRYERNETRLRPRGNFTRCFERARGEFIKFLCDDDLLAPGCVESLINAFRRVPDLTLATSWRQRIDANGDFLGDDRATYPVVEESAVIAGHTLANAMLMAGLNTIGEPSTTLFRKADLLDQAPEYFRFAGVAGHGLIDMVMWSALLLKGDAVYLREPQSSFRIHPGQRQNDPTTRGRNVASFVGLRAAWLALGVHQWQRPDRLIAKPYPPDPDADWQQRPMGGRAARPGARWGVG